MRRIVIIGTALLLASLHSPVSADVIIQGQSFDVTGTFGADFLGVDAFDPALGTLNDVRVSIDGVVEVSGSTFGLTPYTVVVDVDMFGLVGRYFEFSDGGLRFSFTGLESYASCGIGGCIPAPGQIPLQTTAFSLNFHFADFAESIGLNQAFLTGFSSTGQAVQAVPPPAITGSVSDFVADPFVPIDEIDVFMTTSISGGAISATTHLGGAMFITYDYTPHPVPAPGTLALLLIGLACCRIRAGARLRKQVRAA